MMLAPLRMLMIALVPFLEVMKDLAPTEKHGAACIPETSNHTA
jgi:hypothetical protein